MKVLQLSAGVCAIGLVSGLTAASIVGGRRVALLREGAGVLMRYSSRARRGALVVTASPGLATWALAFGGVPAEIAFACGLVLVGAGVLFVVQMFGSSALIQPDALVRVSPWRALTRIEWRSVARIRWVAALGAFELVGRDGTRIRVPRAFHRFGWFALALTDHTPLALIADTRTHHMLIAKLDEFEASR